MTHVEWKQHPRWRLRVSSDGRVIGPSGLELRLRSSNCGYARVVAYADGKAKSLLVHRLVAELFVGGSGEQVNHLNGIKTDNRAENLEWCSRSHNARHAIATGLINPAKSAATKRERGSCAGERNGRSKLTAEQVQEIRQRWSGGYARRTRPWLQYGISNVMFRNIIRGDHWRHA